MYNPFKKEEKRTPIGGFGERFNNIAKNNFRGLLGVLVPACALVPQYERFNVVSNLELMWLMMLWFYLLQPVCIPVTSLIPVFILPFGGIMQSLTTCKSYMNETVLLYVLSGWLVVLLNNSGVDKRIAFWFINSGDYSQYSGRNMVFKCGTAAFFLSMFSNRLIVTYTLTQMMTNIYGKLPKPAKKADDDADGPIAPNYTIMSGVINNAIQTCSGIGGIAIIHSSVVNLLFRGCFQELAPAKHEFPDVFNYLQYSAFAFPVAFVMFLLNLFYHMQLVDKPDLQMTSADSKALMTAVKRESGLVPPSPSFHEMLSVFFALLYLLCVMFRLNSWMPGWADYTKYDDAPDIAGLKDATVAAIFVIILHSLPKGFNFLKIFSAQKKKDLPPLKPESAILFYRYIDKNINYGYIFVFGSAFAILHASTLTQLDHQIGANSGKIITDRSWNIGILIIVVVSSILCNMMTPLAACAIWLPYVLLISTDGAEPWPSQAYLMALGVGVGCNFGFCFPFQYTPAYYCHHTGRVSISDMVKYSIPSVIICAIILYLALIIYAPILWDPEGKGFVAVWPNRPPTTTAEPEPGGP